MLKNYFKIAFRNLLKHKVYTVINIAGLASGIVTVLLIGFWMVDEWSYNKQFNNYPRIAQLYQRTTANGSIGVGNNMPFPMAATLRSDYGSYFQQVALATWDQTHVLTVGNKHLSNTGIYCEQGLPDMLQVQVTGSKDLSDPNSILLAASTAKACFGHEDPLNKTMIVDGDQPAKVTGVYPDFPSSSAFAGVKFIMPWQKYASLQQLELSDNPWRANSNRVFVQIAPNTTMEQVSAVIKDVKYNHVRAEEKIFHAEVFLHPMGKWHLYNEFSNGVNSGGQIQYLWLLGISGFFILLLACINFMNLSTARSETRAREVGVRKAIGSRRRQLILQFFIEALLLTTITMVLSILVIQALLPVFNSISYKEIVMPWSSGYFWGFTVVFSVGVALLAGSYPAMYLSSFRPINVLKGTFRAGKAAIGPRKVLIVTQFTIAMVLLIATLVVYRQVKLGAERPLGYNSNGLITVQVHTNVLHTHFELLKRRLLESNAAVATAEAWSPVTSVWNTNSGFHWPGKNESVALDFPNEGVSHDYGKTVGWQFVAGRDFSKAYASDSNAFVINEMAAKYMGLKETVGAVVTWDNEAYHIIGVVKDVVAESPFEPVRPAFYHISNDPGTQILVRINPEMSVSTAMAKVESIFKEVNPNDSFDYSFVDRDYQVKFGAEQRFCKLVGIFSCLAIFICAIGLYGMAAYMVEQRTKEMGIRRVLGASIFSIWRLLSGDFAALLLIATPLAFAAAYYFMHNWLLNYSYRTAMAWWMFGISAVVTITLSLIAVSLQVLRAASQQPLKSLKSE
ncbi:ABC-type antimicrobial peptide transport system, permease component [Chitinophaga jiangningensis]|uniref:ABC-type antimicrobial peptide transport system, permease component n=1 Tax=Chitinophaga jiangningensis TaxID=1419482 RepID=A0A1M6WRL9_9BACT|nr:ABC transporter permease [Chitinophaga jiangningensis]SHK96402.1 ABC-type antimicrobial peptide transport system, permease component [Chitinophaga jiangningensis]